MQNRNTGQSNNPFSNMLDAIDCCGAFKYIASFSIFQPSYACFAERNGSVVSLSTTYDKSIYDLRLKANYAFSKYSKFNPAPDSESLFADINQLLRNAHFLSRLFVKNAISQNLANSFSDQNKIVILDIGCENALSLPGIIAYFGENRVQYIGVDNNEENIRESRGIYKNYQNVEFIHCDGLRYLNVHHEKFDVVLFQHPNLSSHDLRVVKAFENMLIAAPNALKPNGLLYCTFYYDCEVELFNDSIKYRINLTFNSRATKANQFKAPIYVDSRKVYGSNSGVPYINFSPENYVLKSHPKLSLENLMKKNK